MNIKKIHIDEFGPHHNWSFETGPYGTQLIYGPNESGKTSLLEAVRLLLLGGKHRQYDDIAGSALVERNGEDYYIGRQQKKLDFHKVDGDAIKMEPNKFWWHGLDKKTYNRIFAITLDDMQGADLLKEVDVRTRFFGAEGGEAISAAVKDLDKSSQDLLVGSVNGKRKINVLLEQLEENRKQVAALSRQEGDYVDLGQELTQIDKDEVVLSEQLQDRREYNTGLELALRGWDTYRRAEDAQRHMDLLREANPVDGAAFNALEEQIDYCRDQMRMWKGREEALIPDNFDPKSPLGIYESDIERLYSQVGQWDQWVKEYEQGEAYIDSVKQQVDSFRMHCLTWHGDQEWASQIDWQEGETLGRQLAVARKQYEEARLQTVVFPGGAPTFEAPQVPTFGAKDASTLAVSDASATAATGGTGSVATETAEPAVKLPPLKEVKQERKQAIQTLQDAKYDSSHELYMGLGIGGLVLSAIMVVLGLMIELMPLAVVGVLLAFVSAGILVFGVLKKSRRSKSLRTWSAEIDRLDALIEEIQAAKKKEKEDEQGPKVDLAALEEAFNQALAAWQAWLPQGAVAQTDETRLFNLRDEYTKYHEQLRSYEDQVQMLKNYREKITDMEIVVANVWKHIGYEGEARPVDLRKVYAMLRTFQQNRIRWEQKESQRQSYHQEYAKFMRQEQDLLFKQKELLMQHGMTLASEFRQKLLDQEQFKQWEKIYKQSMDHLRLLAPEGETEALFIRRLHGQKKVDLQTELDRSTRDLADLEGQLAELHERRGQITEAMRALVDDKALDRALQERAQLEGQLTDALEEWATQVFISHCMEDAQGRYEEHKQPQMLAKASSYVQALTGGKYTLAMDSDSDVYAVDPTGRRLAKQHWSSGLGDQVYLALRLSLAELFSQTVEPLPIVLDDVLVRFDKDRQQRALEVLAELGKKQQVVILTCQRELLDMSAHIMGIDRFVMTETGAKPMTA
ncbi:MAG: AAA family ATPase [Veillonella sp.]|nr:AAA family ATPase [Veillonella sp.]